MKAYGRSRGIAPLIPELGIRRSGSTSFSSRFTARKEPWYILSSRMGWPQRRTGRFRRGENPWSMPEFLPSTVQQINRCYIYYNTHTHTHTHIYIYIYIYIYILYIRMYIYIYIYMCVCVCVCVCKIMLAAFPTT